MTDNNAGVGNNPGVVHDARVACGEALAPDDIAGLVRGTLEYFAQTPGALAGNRELQRIMEEAARLKAAVSGKTPNQHKRRGVTRNAQLKVRAVLSMFRYEGRPSCRSARDVARDLGLSIQAVAALLQAAFAENLFSVQVHLPDELTEVIRLEAALQARFGLQRVLLVPGRRSMLDDLEARERRSVHTEVIRAMVRRVADHLDSQVADAARRQQAAEGPPAPFLIGVAWGRTLHLLAEHLLSTKRPPQSPAMQVVPVIGITNTLNTLPVEANVVAMDIARAYGALSGQLPCPAFHPAIEMTTATQARPVRDMLARLRRCDIVITSMGPIVDDPEDGDIRLSNDPDMNERLFHAALFAGAVGEICYWAFDAEGRKVQTPYRSVGLSFEGLQEIARDPKRQVILVCGGDKRRFAPLRAALRARLASVLVSDVWTARYLVDEL